MSELNITFRTLNDVADFVTIAEKYPYNMDLSIGSVVIDAKSLIGIMNLGLNQVINMKVHADEWSDLHQEIEKYIAA